MNFIEQRISFWGCLLAGALFLVSCSSSGVPDSEISSTSVNPSRAQDKDIPITHITPDDILGTIAVSPDGIYTLQNICAGGENILYIDFETKQQIFMCSSPNCTHDAEDCPSYLEFKEGEYGYSVFFHDDALFLVQTATGTDTPPHIARISDDGKEWKNICVLKSGENFLGPVFGYGEDILAETICIEDNGHAIKRLEKINCTTGDRQTIASYPDDAYYGAMHAVGNRIAYIKIDGNGYQYFWLDPQQTNLSISNCVHDTPIDEPFDNEGTGITIQSSYLCKYDYPRERLSAQNLLTGAEIGLRIPKNLSKDSRPNLLYLFDDRFALTFDSADGKITSILLDENGNLLDVQYTKSKMEPMRIVAVTEDTVFLHNKTITMPLKNQEKYGLTGEICYVDIYSHISKEKLLQGGFSEEIAFPAF